MKAIEKDRTRRYETANGLALDIQRFLTDEPVSATPPTTGYRLRKFARRNKTGLRSAAAVACTHSSGGVEHMARGWDCRDSHCSHHCEHMAGGARHAGGKAGEPKDSR